MPHKYDKGADAEDIDLDARIPEENLAFFRNYLAENGVRELEDGEEQALRRRAASMIRTKPSADRLLEVALRHPSVRMVVSALGTPAPEIVATLHERGILVGALAGSPRHALRHVEAGLDVVVAQGSEAAGHTGSISTLVLVPQVIEAVAGRAAVLAAGGIARGEQLVAMLALGAQGVWTGSIWLTTAESELTPSEKQALVAARSDQTMQVTYRSGKPVRTLAGKLALRMREADAPPPLKAPYQQLLFEPFRDRIQRADRHDINGAAVGQAVGMMNHELTVRQVYGEMLNQAADAMERMGALME
jgi:NAD(P)H-dependent flavin oxidoreductase YrpB (nitropropane dioxygenase family)